MKRMLFTAALALALLLYGGAALAQQQGGVQGQGPQGQGWFCPWCGQQYGQGQGTMPRGGQRMDPGYQGRGMGPGKMQRYQGRGMGSGNMRGYQGRGMGPGMMGPGMQGRGMGPGMMQGRQGRGMGPGMMQGRQGRGMGRGMTQERWGRGQYGPNRQPQQQQMGPLQKDAARNLAQNYVAGNPNLNIGEMTEEEDVFVATVVTQDGSLVEKLLMDKETGWMKKEY